MKYAIIADIHGNLHALNAVLADAEAHGVDMYLLLGDYAHIYPYGNEVITTIRKLKPCVAVKGNGEDYIIDLRGSKQQDLTNEQFMATYWAYFSLSPENLEYLANLSETATLCNSQIHLSHFVDLFFWKPVDEYFKAEFFLRLMETATFSHEEYLSLGKTAVLTNPNTLAAIKSMPEGVHLFGHNHLQFHMEYEGRLFINPGSCGAPLDCDSRAPYTVLAQTPSGWSVDERRVSYDLDLVTKGLHASGFHDYSPVWSKLVDIQLKLGKSYIWFFLMHVIETGKEMGITDYPLPNEVWNVAVSTWDWER